MICGLDKEALPNTISEEELVAVVSGRRPGEDRHVALKEFLRRRSPRIGPVLRDLVVDRAAPAELRGAAAIALGGKRDPDNQTALIEALATAEPAVVRRASEALGRIGDEHALAALKRTRVEPGGGTGRSVAFAQTLIGYRLGLGSERLEPPPAAELLHVARDRAVPLTFTPVKTEAFRAARPSLEEALPAIAISEKGSIRFTCRSEHLWIVVPEEVAGERIGARLSDRSAVAAVVLKESTCPGGWYVYEYILSHPQEGKNAEVFGVRPSGIACHYGHMQPSGNKATLTLQALNTPLVPAIEFTAEYDGKKRKFAMTQAFLATAALETQKRPTAPRAMAAPALPQS